MHNKLDWQTLALKTENIQDSKYILYTLHTMECIALAIFLLGGGGGAGEWDK
jgi:hypothetical protein